MKCANCGDPIVAGDWCWFHHWTGLANCTAARRAGGRYNEGSSTALLLIGHLPVSARLFAAPATRTAAEESTP